MVIFVGLIWVDYVEEEKQKPEVRTTRNDNLQEDSQVKTDLRNSIGDGNETVNHPTIGDADSSVERIPGIGEFGERRESGRIFYSNIWVLK